LEAFGPYFDPYFDQRFIKREVVVAAGCVAVGGPPLTADGLTSI
jgi:hypothetical protein